MSQESFTPDLRAENKVFGSEINFEGLLYLVLLD